MRWLTFLALMPSIAWGAVTASFTASRGTDPNATESAPLAVFFDATATTCTGCSSFDAFKELHYKWDFGDAGAGTWTVTGLGYSKNVAYGPVAAHVFESPGTYTVTLTVKDRTSTSTDTATITVDDPDTVFSGTNTVCYRQAATGDFSGCPSGATETTEANWNTICNAATAGKRILLRKGDTWTTGAFCDITNHGPGMIGAFGTGANPILQISGRRIRLRSAEDWRFVDLTMDGTSSSGEGFDTEGCLSGGGPAGSNKNILILRNTIKDYEGWIKIHADTLDACTPGNTENHTGIFVVDGTFENAGETGVTTGDNGFFMAAENMAVMGNDLLQNGTAEHNVRWTYSKGSVMQHNKFRDCGGTIRHLVKIHAGDWADSGVTDGKWNEHIVISDNIFTDPCGNWSVTAGPQSDGASRDERLRNIIIERNYFSVGNGPEHRAALRLLIQQSVIRNNVVDETGADRFIDAIILAGSKNLTPDPNQNQIYNNSCYVGDSQPECDCVSVASGANQTLIQNNVIYGPNCTSVRALGGGGSSPTTCGSCNVDTGATNPYNGVTAPAATSNAADMKLKAADARIDAGETRNENFLDHGIRLVPVNSLHDIGAWEDGASPDAGVGPLISSAANQAFTAGQAATAISAITITDHDTTAEITTTDDIRVRIPSSFGMVWDTTDTTASISGGASSKVSTTVSYEDSDKTLVVDVTTNFATSDQIVVSGLSYTTFTESATDNLELEVDNAGNLRATDDKTIKVNEAPPGAPAPKTIEGGGTFKGKLSMYLPQDQGSFPVDRCSWRAESTDPDYFMTTQLVDANEIPEFSDPNLSGYLIVLRDPGKDLDVTVHAMCHNAAGWGEEATHTTFFVPLVSLPGAPFLSVLEECDVDGNGQFDLVDLVRLRRGLAGI